MSSHPAKIDVHHHFVPDFYRSLVNGKNPDGWPIPSWAPETSTTSMSKLGTSTSILSLTSPGTETIPDQKGARDLARQVNEYASQLVRSSPKTFGFFAALPSLLDTEGALSEICYAFDELHADGVTLFTRYGDGDSAAYLGNPVFAPIWKELNRRSAVVFIHPTRPGFPNQLVNPHLTSPMIDFTFETTKTAVDLIVTNTKRNNPNCKIILSHAGGTLPFIASRIEGIAVSAYPEGFPKSPEQVIEEARSFYYDVALSQSHRVLRCLLDFAPVEHILFGSDFPYAPDKTIESFAQQLEGFKIDDKTREKIYRTNALELFPRLREGKGSQL
ncbi:MAG: hypothetical protein M1834_007802 [Cirrosporium novae-zelandiae]|nr:MAG: hypothetical protein M1834_007802 [Cirrosporium novae-zelandiae]